MTERLTDEEAAARAAVEEQLHWVADQVEAATVAAIVTWLRDQAGAFHAIKNFPEWENSAALADLLDAEAAAIERGDWKQP